MLADDDLPLADVSRTAVALFLRVLWSSLSSFFTRTSSAGGIWGRGARRVGRGGPVLPLVGVLAHLITQGRSMAERG